MPASKSDLFAHHPELKVCEKDFVEIYGALSHCFRQGGKLLLCGNGGSAADADHWAGELLKGFGKKRPLSTQEKSLLPEPWQNKLQGALPTIPLTGFNALSTAFANDVDPTLTFAQLVWGLGRPGDVLVGLSTSGNAANVCAAMEVARAKGLVCIGLTGKDGGKLKSLTDICLRVPAVETYQVQEMHLPVYHCLSLMLEDEFYPDLE